MTVPRAATTTFEVVDARSGGAVWAVSEYYRELDERFPGGFAPDEPITSEAAAYDPPHGAFLLGRSVGSVVACGGVHTLRVGLGEVKRMWVAPSVRRAGLATRLLAALEQCARDIGHERLRLDTNGTLTAAIAMYLDAGYHPIDRYNDNPHATHFFEKSLA